MRSGNRDSTPLLGVNISAKPAFCHASMQSSVREVGASMRSVEVVYVDDQGSLLYVVGSGWGEYVY
jgi:hypothetical protein